VYVTDTGNKRVQVFNADGSFAGQFGQGGVLDGAFDEPVGIALDAEGNIYVADTWNARVQVFSPTQAFVRSWLVTGWYGQGSTTSPTWRSARMGRSTRPIGALASDRLRCPGKPAGCWGDGGLRPGGRRGGRRRRQCGCERPGQRARGEVQHRGA
jgi:hypothetical protein